MNEKLFSRPEAWLREARLYAAQKVPFYASALYRAPFVLVENLPGPAAVDTEGRVYFNLGWLEDFLNSYKGQPESERRILSMLGFLWYHEISHWIRQHSRRARRIKADPNLWNLAADLEINDDLPAGLAYLEQNGKRHAPLPQDFDLPAGKVAEWYYRRLASLHSSPPASSQQDRRGASASSRQNAGFSRVSNKSRRMKQSIQKHGWDEGSGVHGKPRSWEHQTTGGWAPGIPAKRSPTGAQGEQTLSRPGVLQGGRPRGEKVSQSTELRPLIHWQNFLHGVIQGIVEKKRAWRVDYSYVRPHRRSALSHPLILPSMTGQYKPRLACVIDTSGSISDLLLGQTLRELQCLSESLQVPITVIPCDKVAYPPFILSPRMPLGMLLSHLRGGGGTDMREGLQAALSLKPRPDVIIIFTDGKTPYPQFVPAGPFILWVIWHPAGYEQKHLPPMPPWRPGQVRVVPVEKAQKT